MTDKTTLTETIRQQDTSMISLQWFKCLAIDRALMRATACIYPLKIKPKEKKTSANPIL